jgi:hypothetical protein
MNNRIEAMKANNKGKEQFCKTSLNGSYGYDGLNTEKYTRTKLLNKSQTFSHQIFDNHVNTRPLSDDSYLVTYNPRTFKCETCLQESFFTLDNAKFWYLNFVYNFMYKCLDMNKIHFIEGDTDSAYWAVGGNSNESYKQGFKYVVKDQEFYDQHVYEWFPDPSKDVSDMKKLLGLAIENQDENCVALAPKCYCLFPKVAEELLKKQGIITQDPKLLCVTKMKGVKKSLNKLTAQDYQSAIVKPIIGKNINLQMKNRRSPESGKMSSVMSKITIRKNAITGVHTKAIVLSNHSCAPFVFGYDANEDYSEA